MIQVTYKNSETSVTAGDKNTCVSTFVIDEKSGLAVHFCVTMALLRTLLNFPRHQKSK